MSNQNTRIDGFILPGHVSVITGINAYTPFFEKYQIPCVISGFEPVDMMQAIRILIEQIEENRPALINAYQRAVTRQGNKKAREILDGVFEKRDTAWRGLGIIRESGLRVREEYGNIDAEKVFYIEIPEASEPEGCSCGDILTGLMIPPECPLFKRICTPIDPVGPCMVSSEGTCAAYYRYYDKVQGLLQRGSRLEHTEYS